MADPEFGERVFSRSVLCSYRLTSYTLPETRLVGIMQSRTEIVEIRVYRCKGNRKVLCRLICEVTPYRRGLFRWFLDQSRNWNNGHGE